MEEIDALSAQVPSGETGDEVFIQSSAIRVESIFGILPSSSRCSTIIGKREYMKFWGWILRDPSCQADLTSSKRNNHLSRSSLEVGKEEKVNLRFLEFRRVRLDRIRVRY